MKKLLLLVLILANQFSLFAQCTGTDCISQSGLAEILYIDVYQDASPLNYPASNFSCPFIPIHDDPIRNQKIKTISFLDYGDGITPVSHISAEKVFSFPDSELNRFDTLIMVMEAYNIRPSDSGVTFFEDLDEDSIYAKYVKSAIDEGILINVFPPSVEFKGFFSITLNQTLQLLANLRDSSFYPVSNTVLSNPNNYFIPNNFTPENLGTARGLSQGVFSHYAKDSFVIPDVKLNLNFSHYYSTALVELPQSYFPVQPLGRGWTHTYNSYIIRENDVGEDEIDYYYIIWPDGTIHMYNEDDDEYVTQGVYDDFDEVNSRNIEITTKNQIHYFYEQLDNDQRIYYLVKIEDRNGNDIDIRYETSDVDNNFKRIKEVVSPSGKKLTFEYYSNTDHIKEITDPIDRNIAFEYNEERLKEFKDAKNQETRYYYLSNDEDAPGRHQYKRFLLRRVRLPRGNSIKAKYDNDNDGKLIEYQINGDDPVKVSTEFFTQDNSIESTVEVPMPNGTMQEFKYEYDENNVLTHFENDTQDIDVEYPSSGPNVLIPNRTSFNGVDFRYNYDDRGNMTRKRAEGIIDENYRYNSLNDITRYTDSRGNQTNFSYDSNGNLIQIQDQSGDITVFDVNNRGQVRSTTNPEGITVNYEYESDGALARATAPENQESTFNYDGINRMLSKTVNGQISSYLYDNNDNVTSNTNIGGYTTTYNYDANDNVKSITNAKGVATSFEYDDEDRVISETFGNLTKQYRYDEKGFQDRYTKPSGVEVNYEYDDEGRLEETGTITDFVYNNRNLVSGIANANSRLNFTYDDINRVIEVEDEFNNVDIEYEYDDNGNITKIIYPPVGGESVAVVYEYNRKNLMSRVLVERGGVEKVIVNYAYLKDNRPFATTSSNGIRTLFSYDNVGRLTRCQTININDNNSEIYDHQITLDRRSNITEQYARYQNQSEDEADGPGFIGGNTPNISSPNGDTNTFANIANQNLSSIPALGTVNYTYDDNNQIQGNNHDVNDDGNTIQDNYNTYSWDIDDRLISRTHSNGDQFTYTYNPYNQRISKTTNGQGTKYIWDVLGKNIIATTNSSGTIQEYYIYGSRGLEATVLPNGNITYLHGDHRGNVTTTTNESGNIINQYIYDDFGKYSYVGETPDTDTNSFTFMGKYGIVIENSEQGLYYVRARYYNASTGRFLSEDPIWSTNLYSYSDNNPLLYVDPSGKNKNLVWLQNVNKAYNMTKEWHFGYGPSQRRFVDDGVANSFRDANGVNLAREFFYEKYKGVDDLTGASVTEYGSGFGLEGLKKAGLDPIEQFVGSFDVDIYVIPGDELLFRITNVTSFKSFTYQIGEDWERDFCRFAGNTRQTYIFTEPIRKR